MPVSDGLCSALWFVMRLVWAECLCVVNYGSSCGDMGGVRVHGVLVVCGLVTCISVPSLPSFLLQQWPWSMRHRFSLPLSYWGILRLEPGDHWRVSSLPRGQQCSVQVCRPVKQRHLLWAGPLAVVTSPCPGPATAHAQCAARLRAEHTCGQWQHIITDKHNNTQWQTTGHWINVCMQNLEVSKIHKSDNHQLRASCYGYTGELPAGPEWAERMSWWWVDDITISDSELREWAIIKNDQMMAPE